MTTTTYCALSVLETVVALSFPAWADEPPATPPAPAVTIPTTSIPATNGPTTNEPATSESSPRQPGAPATTSALAPAEAAPAGAAPLFRIQPAHPRWAAAASGSGNLTYLAAGTAAPLFSQEAGGQQRALRTADAVITATLLTQGLKTLVHEKRPDGSDNQSFPSGHATAAFALATMEAHYHPQQSLLWYGGAALIGASRVGLKRHYWHDVVAGAAVGYLTARLELGQDRGLLLRPFIHADQPGHPVSGLTVSGAF